MQFDQLNRREFITLVGGAAAAWPIAARAQQREPIRRIGVLLPATADDQEFQAWVGAFLQGLAQLGWIIGRNLRVEMRWAGNKVDDIRRHTAELIAIVPDAVLAHGASTVRPLLQATRAIPIVFPIVGDPGAAGFVASLARPGGDATGFMTTQCSARGNRVEVVEEIAPSVTRVVVLRDDTQGSGVSEFAVV